MNKAFSSFKKEKWLPATWLVIISGTLYGFLGFFGTQVINEGLSIPAMLFWRFLIAMIWMSLWGLKKKNTPFSQQNYLRLLPMLILTGLFYAGSSAFYFFASTKTGTGLAMVIFFAYPIFIAVAVWANNNWRINKTSLIALLLVLIGLTLLEKTKTTNINISGLAFALLASLSYALYIYKSKQVITKFESSEFTTLICFISALIFLVICITTHQFAIPATIKGWVYTLALAIFATALPIQLLLDGLKSISMLKASILSALEPIITLFVGVLALHEVITIQQLFGVIVIIAGSIVIQFARET